MSDKWMPQHDWLEQQAMTPEQAKDRIRKLKIEIWMLEYIHDLCEHKQTANA